MRRRGRGLISTAMGTRTWQLPRVCRFMGTPSERDGVLFRSCTGLPRVHADRQPAVGARGHWWSHRADAFGRSLSYGDFDGDSFADLVVSDPGVL